MLCPWQQGGLSWPGRFLPLLGPTAARENFFGAALERLEHLRAAQQLSASLHVSYRSELNNPWIYNSYSTLFPCLAEREVLSAKPALAR